MEKVAKKEKFKILSYISKSKMGNEKQLRREILMSIIDEKIGKILDKLFQNPKKGYYLSELSEESGVSLSSTYRILKKLLKLKIVREEIVGPIKMYYLSKNPQTSLLGELINPGKSVIKIIREFFSNIIGIERIVSYGRISSDKATLLLIGKSIDTSEVEKRKEKLKHEGILVNHIILTPEQYEQMSILGLYPGEKKEIWNSDQLKEGDKK